MVKDALGDDETPGQRGTTLAPLLLNALQNVLQARHVVMVEPADSATRDLQPFLNGEVDTAVGYDDIPTLAECWDDGADG